MAPPPKKSAARSAKAAEPTRELRAPRPAAQSTGGDSNRLLREAAWSRMFGRTDSKNPFTR